MNFDLGPDELALQRAIRELCERRFPLERTRVEGMDDEGWRALEASGVFALRRATSDGGLGLGMTEAVIAFEELGRALVPGPIAASHVTRTLGAPEQKPTVMERTDPFVEHFDFVDGVVVLDDDGVHIVRTADVDATPVEAPLDPMTPLHRVRALPGGKRVAGPDVAARVRRECAALHAAMLAGIAGRLTEMAVDYAKQREQFGRPIGSFQAVKHICADMLVRAEVARAAAYAAGCTLDDPDAGEPARAVAGAKLVAGDAAIANGKACVQVYGGMGFTWDVPVHLYLKRAVALASTFGRAHDNEEALASML